MIIFREMIAHNKINSCDRCSHVRVLSRNKRNIESMCVSGVSFNYIQGIPLLRNKPLEMINLLSKLKT